jgi:hypothetical protein
VTTVRDAERAIAVRTANVVGAAITARIANNAKTVKDAMTALTVRTAKIAGGATPALIAKT